MLTTKLKKYNKMMVKKSTILINKIVSKVEILGGRVPAGKQGMWSSLTTVTSYAS